MSLKSEAIHPLPKAGILDISPYVPGKSAAKGAKIYKLSSNKHRRLAPRRKPWRPMPPRVICWRFIPMVRPRNCARRLRRVTD